MEAWNRAGFKWLCSAIPGYPFRRPEVLTLQSSVSIEGGTAEMQPGLRPSRLAEGASTSSDNGFAVARG